MDIWREILYFDRHRLFGIQSLAPPRSRVFAEYGDVLDGALKESFVSFVLVFLFSFLIPSSDVFDCEHVPYSTRMHSTNNSLAGGKKNQKENFSSQRDKRGKVLEASLHHCIRGKK